MPQIKDSFILNSTKPNFSRDYFENLDDMKNVNINHIDDGHISYCAETKTHYVFDPNNITIDLGPWRLLNPDTDLNDMVYAKTFEDLKSYENSSFPAGQLSYCAEDGQIYYWSYDSKLNEGESQYGVWSDKTGWFKPLSQIGDTIYLKIEDAENTYLTQEDAERIYQTKEESNSQLEDFITVETLNDYLTKTAASKTYLTKTDGEKYIDQNELNTFGETIKTNISTDIIDEIGTQYIPRSEVEENYLSKDTASSDYLSKESASETYLTKTDAGETYASVGTVTELSKDINSCSQDISDIGKKLEEIEENKANKSTTLAGYGITDAYKDTEIDEKIEGVKKEILGITGEETISEAYDTLKEISEWIENDESGAAAILNDVTDLKENKANKSTTLGGYGITDAYTKEEINEELVKKVDSDNVYSKSEVDSKLENKANKSTTLEGYGITDAYTKEEINKKFQVISKTDWENLNNEDKLEDVFYFVY